MTQDGQVLTMQWDLASGEFYAPEYAGSYDLKAEIDPRNTLGLIGEYMISNKSAFTIQVSETGTLANTLSIDEAELSNTTPGFNETISVW